MKEKMKHPTIYPTSLDMEKSWFVQYWTNETTPQRKKQRVPDHSEYETRIAAANKIIKDLKAANFIPKNKKEKKGFIAEKCLLKAFEALENRKGTLGKNTYYQFKSHLKGLNAWCAKKKITVLKVADAELFLDDLMLIGLKPKTVNNYRITINAVLNPLLKRKEIQSNPFNSTGRKRGESDCPEWFKMHEAEKLRAYMLQHKPFVWSAARWEFYCLMRPSAIRNLTVGDVDFERWVVKLKYGNTKNKRTYYVKIPPGLQAELQPLCLYQYPNNYYLVGSDGKPSKEMAGRDYFNTHHKTVLSECGFCTTKYKFYGWKHTGFALAYLAGVGILELMHQAGHQNPNDTYTYMRRLGLQDFTSIETKYPVIGLPLRLAA